ncbi:MAG: 3-carboxy-cis,cis-muconate cycloisomerase [Hyphomicrobiales bacterium]|nr:MAG: 3-carboxy-cis,cis-muconate cycloisomerase [Hyphomicrobiales bacterium]
MSSSVFNHPFLSGLLGDEELEAHFSAQSDIAAMLRFESALAHGLADAGIVSEENASSAITKIKDFAPDMDALKNATARDGVVIPELVRQLKAACGDDSSAIHFGATSQDVIDTSLILRLRSCIEILEARLKSIDTIFQKLITEHGEKPLMGRTRMQAALPVTIADRVNNWRIPLQHHLTRLNEIKPRLLLGQFGGAVGTLNKFDDNKASIIRSSLASELAIDFEKPNWHTKRDNLVEFSNWLSMVSGSIGKIGKDIVLMNQNELGELQLSGAGGSSAMPHKQNPVKAETLVTLAAFNAAQISAMHHTLVHEQERSGSAWTLEWMALPQMVITTGNSLSTLEDLLNSIVTLGK